MRTHGYVELFPYIYPLKLLDRYLNKNKSIDFSFIIYTFLNRSKDRVNVNVKSPQKNRIYEVNEFY